MSRTPGEDGRDGDNRTVVDRHVAAATSGRPAPPAGRAPLAAAESDDEPGATMMIHVPGAGAPDAKAAPGEAHLACVAGNDAGQLFPLRQNTVLVGRGLNCNIVLNDPSVSRRHFNILRTPDGWKLLDLGSGNGTRVDGANVQEVELVEGTRIEVGITTLRFTFGPAQAAAAARPAPGPAPQPAPPAPVMPRQPAPAPAPRQQAQPRPQAPPPRPVAPEPEMKVVSPPFQPPPERAAAPVPRGGGGGALKVIVIVLAILVLGGGGFVLADKFAGLGIIFPTTKFKLPKLGAIGSGGGEEGGEKGSDEGDKGSETATAGGGDFETLYEAALAHMKEREWDGALKKLDEAEEAAEGNDADLADVRKATRRARAERDAAMDWKAGVDAAAAGNVDEARKNLSLVPDDSVYYLEAQEKLRTLAAAPEQPGGEKPGTETPTGEVKPPASAGERDALKLFADKKFDEAAAAFGEMAAAAEAAVAKSEAVSKATAVKSFAVAWAAADTATERARHDEAVERLEEALQLNETVGGTLDGEVKKKLAAVLVARGHVHLRKKELQEAGDDFQRALTLDPAAADAQGAKKKVAESAQDLLAQARDLLQQPDQCPKARRLFELVQWATGEDDPARIEAGAFLESLKDVPNCAN